MSCIQLILSYSTARSVARRRMSEKNRKTPGGVQTPPPLAPRAMNQTGDFAPVGRRETYVRKEKKGGGGVQPRPSLASRDIDQRGCFCSVRSVGPPAAPVIAD